MERSGSQQLRQDGSRILTGTGITRVMVRPGRERNRMVGQLITMDTGSTPTATAGYGYRDTPGAPPTWSGPMVTITSVGGLPFRRAMPAMVESMQTVGFSS